MKKNYNKKRIVKKTKEILEKKYRKAGIEFGGRDYKSASITYERLSKILKVPKSIIEDIIEEELLKKGWAFEPVPNKIMKI